MYWGQFSTLRMSPSTHQLIFCEESWLLLFFLAERLKETRKLSPKHFSFLVFPFVTSLTYSTQKENTCPRLFFIQKSSSDFRSFSANDYQLTLSPSKFSARHFLCLRELIRRWQGAGRTVSMPGEMLCSISSAFMF